MSAKLTLRFPDGASREYPSGTTLRDVAESLSRGLAKSAVAAVVDEAVLDLGRPLQADADVRFLTPGDPEALEVLRHSSAHLMAQAVKRLFPEARFGVGPVIEKGFYYDIDLSRTLTPEDLQKIEREMKKVVKENAPIIRMEWPRDQALHWAQEREDPYKEELIGDIPEGESISLYEQGDFVDLCTGPHMPRTGKIKHFKLLSVAGAYWRGDEHRTMMQRIYGTAFFTQEELDDYLHWREEAERRDHRKLGKQLDLFMFHPLAPASPFFLPKGAQLYNSLIDYVRELYQEFGFQEVVTPQIFQSELWKTSGHYEHFRDNMFFCEADGIEYGVKPMNCPAHMLMFAAKVHSYRDLPLRYADFGRLHRYERSGTLRGLTRVRTFSQDDAHVFITADMIGAELDHNFEMLHRMHRDLGLGAPEVFVGTRPDKAVGEPELWEHAEAALVETLDRRGQEYTLNPGDGAFYGPKIDFATRDALGHEHQLSTLQLDFNLPERFGLKYSASDGSLQRPVVVHRAFLGSLERFLGVYLEHTGGNLPVWLAPVQARVLSVATDFAEYAQQVGQRLRQAGLRAEVDDRNEKIGAKIRSGTLEKIPYLLVVGRREVDSGAVAVRRRGEGDQGAVGLKDFVDRVLEEIRSRGG